MTTIEPMSDDTRQARIEAGALMRAYRSGQIGRTECIKRVIALGYSAAVIAAILMAFDLSEETHDRQ